MLQLIKDNNLNATSTEPKLGYGQIPLRNLKNTSDYTEQRAHANPVVEALSFE